MTRTTGVVVAHGDLASALVSAAEGIAGIENALHPVSNAGLSPDQLMARIESHVGNGPAVVFTDLLSGSCTFACRAVSRKRGAVAVVTGTSLPMLIDFLFNLELAPEELATRVVEKGRLGATVIVDREDGDGA